MKKALAILQSQIDYLERRGELNKNDSYQLQVLLEIKEALIKPCECKDSPQEEIGWNQKRHCNKCDKII